jgi:hypothetical protein
MPSPRSRECWNPAVPPPPVAGAAVGNGLAVAEGLGDGVAEGLGDGVAVGLTVGLGVVPLGRVVGVGEPDAPGEMVGGDAPGEDEQAETVAEPSMATAAQPATVSLARWPVPMMVVRIFMVPPADSHKDKGHRRHRHAMACSSLEHYATRSERPGEDGRS